METTILPEPIERIAQEAEAGAAQLARSAIVLGYQLIGDLVEEVKASVQAARRSEPQPLATAVSKQSQFLSIEEAAEFLRLKPSTLYAGVSKDKIPYSKIGSRILFEKEALIEFVKARGKCTEKPHVEDSQTRLRVLK